MKRLVVMISGNGTNLQALIDACQTGALNVKIVAVFSSRAGAYGLERASRAGIPVVTFPLAPYKEAGKQRSDYDLDLTKLVATFKPDLIVLAGWMLVLSPTFLDHFPRQVINLHPALAAQFPGTDAIARAYTAFQRGEIDHTGVMVHWVIPEIDAGQVIASAPVAIRPEDTLQDLEARVHETEHRLVVEATALALQHLSGSNVN